MTLNNPGPVNKKWIRIRLHVISPNENANLFVVCCEIESKTKSSSLPPCPSFSEPKILQSLLIFIRSRWIMLRQLHSTSFSGVSISEKAGDVVDGKTEITIDFHSKTKRGITRTCRHSHSNGSDQASLAFFAFDGPMSRRLVKVQPTALHLHHHRPRTSSSWNRKRGLDYPIIYFVSGNRRHLNMLRHLETNGQGFAATQAKHWPSLMDLNNKWPDSVKKCGNWPS